jgi:hypothetical protein
MSIKNNQSGRPMIERLLIVAFGILLIIAFVLSGYMATYVTAKEAEDFSPFLLGLGLVAFVTVWWLTLLCTMRAVIKLYDLRLEHPGWTTFFNAANDAMDTNNISVDIEPLLRYYFLLPISKSGLLKLSIASYFMTIYGYALSYKFISMSYPDAFTPNPLDLPTAMYFSVVTIATVGYGDVLPVKTATKLLVSTEILAGVSYSVFFFSILANLIREPRNVDPNDPSQSSTPER